MKKRSLKEKSEENIPGGCRKFFKNKEDFIIRQKKHSLKSEESVPGGWKNSSRIKKISWKRSWKSEENIPDRWKKSSWKRSLKSEENIPDRWKKLFKRKKTSSHVRHTFLKTCL